jgi:phenylacetate-CoA ligase
VSIAYHIIKLYEKVEGRNFSIFYDTFKKSEFSSSEDLKSLQLEKLKKLITHAYQTVPYYKEKFNSIGFEPDDLKTLNDIKQLPFLSKEQLKSNYSSLISKSYNPSQLIEYATGGSSGVPTNFLLTKEQYDSRTAVSFKAYQMTGWDFMKKTVILSSAPIESSKKDNVKGKLKSFFMRQYTIPTFDLNEKKLYDICHYSKRKKPHVIFGYVSSLLLFAQYVETHKIKIRIPTIVQMAEMIYPDQIKYIEKFLNGKFFKQYGARDAIAMGIECFKRHGLHANMDTLLIEIVKNNKEIFEEDGEIFVTDLYSFGMPLIRYQIGDVGKWKRDICSCGRAAPLFEITQGRKTNIISTKDGTFMSGIFIPHLFKELSPKINKYQVIQPDIDHLIIRIVKQSEYGNTDEEFLSNKLKEKLGKEISIKFEYPQFIPPEPSGKYMFVKSNVPISFGNK